MPPPQLADYAHELARQVLENDDDVTRAIRAQAAGAQGAEG